MPNQKSPRRRGLAHSMKWASLGLDKLEDAQELPELPIIDYSEAQIEEIRRKQREAYQSKDECVGEEEIEA